MSHKASKFLLKTTNAPRYAYRHLLEPMARTTDASFLGLQRSTRASKYHECLRHSDLVVMVNWVQTDLVFNQPYYWKMFAKKLEDGVFHHEPVDSKLYNELFGIPDADPSSNKTDVRIWTQDKLNLQTLNHLLEMVRRDDSKFSISSIGINVNAKEHEMNAATYIQHLVRESTEKYNNINYEKLLQIAREQRTTPTSHERIFKDLLLNLADLELTRTSLAKDKRWIFFTAPVP
ncbi:hypothetical protein TPHA_0O00170 [Tetrapisispora phaffii CBS 4417]|uniref:Uncharacterized protein n=1 Tax=Tetrapisispora phaffii (strain ATCC 24235 / CBS 4417 / NBRC 1672 / NRRL Y-8282 / UCD 70-5) TaxID=1071381 RepID=G8C1G1_TETPH|nr:hypothetical protein TPHA_0O00170 [Tetrapisispora phaffii CBS 4417]CCE65989.1 hypothetical protein TPHA_0O00170 [Tetrapisispora phaffii CBS 4417]